MVCPCLSFLLNNPLRKLITNPEATLEPYVRPGQTVADIGCGPGLFTITLANLVGPNGRVIAIDVQGGMLERVKKNAQKYHLEDRITLHQCNPDTLGIHDPLDFALCFWVMHEVASQQRLFAEIHQLMTPGALLLVTEPWIHVRSNSFRRTILNAHRTGFETVAEPRIRSSRAVLLTPAGCSVV